MPPLRFSLCLKILLLSSLVHRVSAAVVTVSPSESIKAAINASLPGDTVLVLGGVYTGLSNCDLVVDKDLALIGPDGSERTIVDCQSRSRCLSILNGAKATVSGFSFLNGRAPGTDRSEHASVEFRSFSFFIDTISSP